MKKISILLWLAVLATVAIRHDARAGEPPAGNVPTIDGTMPSFEGGSLSQFRKWFDAAWQEEFKLCRKEDRKTFRKGRLCNGAVIFSVDTTGCARFEGVHPATMHKSQIEVIRRTLAKSPLWKPGIQHGRKVKVRFTIPHSPVEPLQPKPEPIR